VKNQILCLCCILAAIFPRAAVARQTVSAPPFTVKIPAKAVLTNYPVLIELPATTSVRAMKGAYLLSGKGQKTWEGRAEVLRLGGKTYLAVIAGSLRPGQTAVFTAVPGKPSGPASTVTREQNGTFAVRVGENLLARFNSTGAPKPYLWPLYAPGGVSVTRDYPMRNTPGEDTDHPHHRGLWFTHGSVNGIDFWTEGPDKGRTVTRSCELQSGSKTASTLHCLTDWMGPDGRRVCQDERTYVFWTLMDPRVIDVFITVKATNGPVTFGDTKEGSFALRVPKWMTVTAGTGHILTSEGKRDGAAWGTQAAWVDYTGRTQTGETGVAMLQYPGTFRYPTYWHARDYGLFSANPFGLRDFTDDKTKDGSYTLPKGANMKYAFRLILHRGGPAEAGVDEFSQQLQAPAPQVSFR